MKKAFLVAGCWIFVSSLSAQSVSEKLQKAYQQFESDSQLRHAISSLYVINAKTGEVVFDKNSQVGLAGASTQKIITAATAFELLGRDYKYKTEFGYDGEIDKDSLKGNMYIIGSGDPTFGSWRYKSTNPDSIVNLFYNSLTKAKIKWVKGSMYINEKKFETQTIPNGWIWEDIGNYYGAGSSGINWRENQYDIALKSGKYERDPVRIIKRSLPRTINDGDSFSELKTGKLGSGDNAYVYFSPRSRALYYRGTIPPNQDSFIISASSYSPAWILYHELHFNKKSPFIGEFAKTFEDFCFLQQYGGNKEYSFKTYGLDSIAADDITKYDPYKKPVKIIEIFVSPPLDSIIYWFLKKSINLYGEALIKTFALEKKGVGATDTGVVIVKEFWKQKGLDPEELNIKDGSGLSPQNRITTHAQVEILKYAKKQSWFPYFFDALPEYNNMKMKSGTISDVKGFCGYHTSGDGTQYIFSFLVNNYSGSSSLAVQKMYTVLDVLK